MLQSLLGFRSATNIAQVDAFQLNELLDEKDDLLLLDVRSPQEYQYDGHIEGSRLLPLQVLMQRYQELPKDRQIIVICRSGSRSQAACEQLSRLGYSNVKNFRGGMLSWKRAGFPVR
jgi:rhodanese-related sulfurtransferase